MTCFILQVHTGTGVSNSQHRRDSGEVGGGEPQLNGPKGQNLAREKYPWQQASYVWLYVDLLPALKGEPVSSVSLTDGF